MPELVNRNVRLILGKTGSGKTTLARQFVKGLPRALIVDSGFNQFGAPNFMNLGDLHDYLDERGGPGGNFRANYTPLMIPRQLDESETLFRWALELGNAEEMTLVLEECDRFPSTFSAWPFTEIIQRGRHFGVHVLGLTTHPYAVDINLRRQATEIFTFRQHEPNDLKWLSAVMSGDALEEIMRLGDYEFIKWTARTGAIEKGKTKLCR